MSDPTSSPSSLILQVVVPLLDSKLMDVLGFLARLGLRLLRQRVQRSLYEVFDHHVRLELTDPRGHKAIYFKDERVRFLQDNVIAYQDQAWGDGNIFADYQCSPGVAVDRYREGNRYRILISLRETKHAGDIIHIRIRRSILDGFTRQREHFQTRVEHPMKTLSISVIFPRERLPKRVTLIEQNSTRTLALGPEHYQHLPDGREQVIWHTDHPRLFECYILRWEW